MNFLVTGSSSYVGKYIIKYLLNEEHDVIGTSRSKPNIINKNFFFIKNDLTKNQIKIKKKIDYVIHVAGNAWMGLKDIKYIESNIIGTYNLYKSLKLLKPKCIFYISSRDIYGQVKKKILKENSDILNPILYGHSKYIAEKILSDLKNAVILRCPSIIGKGTHGWIHSIVKKLNKSENINYENTKFNNFIYAGELPKIILTLIKKNKLRNSTFVLGCSDKIYSKEIILFLKDRFNSNSKLSEIRSNNKFYTISIQKLLKIYKPMTVNETLVKYLNDLKDYK